MRSQLNPNIHSLLREELVKRFETGMRQEMALHSEALSSYQKEMQSLRESILSTKESVEKLFHHTETELKDKTAHIRNQIENLEIKIKSLNAGAVDQRNTILSLYQSFNDFILSSPKKSDFEKFKDEVYSHLHELNQIHTRDFESYQQYMKGVVHQLLDGQRKFKAEIEKKLSDLENVINDKYNHFKMDKEGISKEIKIYEKTIFIIEKKIENIYTLIERINKRGEVCHKQV